MTSSGSDLADPQDRGSAAVALEFVDALRLRGLVVGHVKVGAVEVSIAADLKALGSPKPVDPPEPQNMLKDYGGDLMRRLDEQHKAEDGEASRTTEDDEEDVETSAPRHDPRDSVAFKLR